MRGRFLPLATLTLLLACGGKTEPGLGETTGGANAGGANAGGANAGGANAGGANAGGASEGGATGEGGTTSSIGMGGFGGDVSSAGGSGSSGSAGASADWASCGKPGDCLLEPHGCCGSCGKPQSKDLDAVDYLKGKEHFAAVCSAPNGTCPGCASQPNANLAAFCRASQCGVVEIASDEVSLCATDSDCEMHRAQCCDCGTAPPDQYVALNGAQVGAYEAQICGPNVGGCGSDCASAHPPGYGATCNPATKHCQVTKTVAKTGCPPQVPTGGACALPNGTTCEYGDSPVVSCREHAICLGGVWSFPPSVCPVLGKGGENGCLADPSQSGSKCPTNGQVCDLAGDILCECNSCLGGPCMQFPVWGCSSPVAPGCPAVAPDTGQPCALQEGQSCNYGAMCSSTMAVRICKGGVWFDQAVACAG